MKNASRILPSRVLLHAESPNVSWEWLKSGRSGTSSMSERTRHWKAARSDGLAARCRSPVSSEILPSVSIRYAKDLGVLLIFDRNNTVLCEVCQLNVPLSASSA